MIKKICLYCFVGILFLNLSAIGFASSNPGCDCKSSSDTSVSDLSLAKMIKEQVQEDSFLSDLNIDVKSNHGNITLTGVVATKSQADKVKNIAKSNKWVKVIDDKNLKVKSSQDLTADLEIKGRAKVALTAIGSSGITIEAKDKVVYLSGEVVNQEQADKVVAAVKTVPKVNSIKSDIKVKK